VNRCHFTRKLLTRPSRNHSLVEDDFLIMFAKVPVVKDVGDDATELTVLAVGVVNDEGAVVVSVTHRYRAEYFK